MAEQAVAYRQVVDWRAAIWAGVIAGLVFLVLEVLATVILAGGSIWVPFRYTASLLLGERVLPPPPGFEWLTVLVALLIHLALSILYACILAFIIHRGGLLIGILGGALFGLALYAINYYTFSFFFPWFFTMRNWIAIVGLVLYGAVAGGIYEALERERYIVVEEEAVEKEVIEEDNHV